MDTIVEILVTHKDGSKILYKDKGITKFKKLLLKPPVEVIDVDDDEQTEDLSRREGTPSRKSKKVTRESKEDDRQSLTHKHQGGYKSTDFSYSPVDTSPKNIADVAKQMAQNSGLNFS